MQTPGRVPDQPHPPLPRQGSPGQAFPVAPRRSRAIAAMFDASEGRGLLSSTGPPPAAGFHLLVISEAERECSAPGSPPAHRRLRTGPTIGSAAMRRHARGRKTGAGEPPLLGQELIGRGMGSFGALGSAECRCSRLGIRGTEKFGARWTVGPGLGAWRLERGSWTAEGCRSACPYAVRPWRRREQAGPFSVCNFTASKFSDSIHRPVYVQDRPWKKRKGGKWNE